MPQTHDLWVTARCAEADLDLPVWPDADGVSGSQHPALQKFAEQRSLEPEPHGDAIGGTQHRLFKLRVGQDRGATWYDRKADCVFLVAYGEHRTGSRNDFYERLPARLETGELEPSEVDYEYLALWRADRWFRELRDDFGPALLREAETAAREGAVSELLYDLEYCELRVKALLRDDGSVAFRLRLDQVAGRPYLHPRRAALIAEAIAFHMRRPATSIWDWDGEPLPYEDLAFEV